MTTHHAPEDLLLAYASGTADEGEALLVASHLTLCPACRDRVAALEAVGGALLDAAPEEQDGIEALLGATLDALERPAPAPPPVAHDPDGILPAPLFAHLGAFSALPWRWFLPSVEQIELDLDTPGMPVRLFRLAPDYRVPDHSHVGTESSLVLTGGFTDDEGHFGRGDVCVRGGEVHRQRIDPGEPCVVLVLADEPLVPHTLRGRLARLVRTV